MIFQNDTPLSPDEDEEAIGAQLLADWTAGQAPNHTELECAARYEHELEDK